MTPPTTPPTAPYSGWLRTLPGGKAIKTQDGNNGWIRVCEGESYWLCWDALLAIPITAGAVERTVLASGKHPERRPRPY